MAKYQNCLQVKYKHRNLGGTFQWMPILKWKWQKVMMDFVGGLMKKTEKMRSYLGIIG